MPRPNAVQHRETPTRRECHLTYRNEPAPHRSRDRTPRRTAHTPSTTANLSISLDGTDVTALVDTGADYSILSGNFAATLKKVTTPWMGPQIRTAGGHLVTPTGTCTSRVAVQGATYLATFVILEHCSRDVILGMDFLTENGAVIDLQSKAVCFSTENAIHRDPDHPTALCILDDHVTIPPRSSIMVSVGAKTVRNFEGVAEGNQILLFARSLAVARGVVNLVDGETEVLITNFGGAHQHLNVGTVVAHVDAIAHVSSTPSISTMSLSQEQSPVTGFTFDVNPALSPTQQQQVKDLLLRYGDIFSVSSRVGRTHLAKHRIITDDNVHPLRQSPYRVSPAERDAIGRQVKEMLRDDVIRPSRSPWAAPVVLVKKKDGTLRFCVDYRRLNKITKKDVYPLPRIDDALDRLCSAKYFSSMDLKSGYWQIEVDERDREKTAFITPDGLYEFTAMPFGLCSAPATFQRLMDTVLADLKWQTCLVYLDDVVVFAPTFQEHLHRLELVLQAIRSSGLTLKNEKCHFAYTELKFLGHVVNQAGVQPDPEKTTAIAHFPPPQDLKAVRRFLGLCAYYRRFVKDFARIAEPLTRLTRSDTPFTWEAAQENAFRSLQSLLQAPPVLAHFDVNADTELHTDASNIGLGAVLVQIQAGQERVIAYASRCLSPAESNYSATEKECLAIVWATSKFRPYLYGKNFKVVTDHHALCWLASLKDPSARLVRWSLRLQEYDMTVVYKSGRKHSDADCLSRAPVDPSTDACNDDDILLTALSASCLADQQCADLELRDVMEFLNGSNTTAPRAFRRVLPSLCIRNGLLVKKNFAPNNTQYLIVVPPSLRNEILQASHDEPTSGHLGIARTLARIQENYYWPRLRADVTHYVRTCRACQRRKVPSTKQAGFLMPIRPPTRPFQRIGMDMLGPFPRSNSGNKWIIVATDYLTRYAETSALPSGTALEVAKFFVHQIVLRHGAPEVLITDRGPAFMAELLQEILVYSHTDHRRTTSYHPQTNGLTERLNRTLSDMISMYVDIEHKTWDEVLPYVTFAYNTAMQETTQMSPFQLVYGRAVTTMLDAMLPHLDDSSLHTDTYTFLERAEAARQLAKVRIQDQQLRDADRYNRRRHDVHYAPGDRVWVWFPIRRRGLSEKLLHRYFGPYRVVRSLGDLNYEVIPDGFQKSRRSPCPEVVHVVRLKPYHDR